MKKKIFAIILAGTMVISGAFPAAAATKQETQQKKSEIQQELNENKQKINTAEKQKQELQKGIEELDQKNTAIQKNLEDLTVKITDTEKKIEKNGKKLGKAEDEKEHQYQNMKKRIQYMYENGNSALTEILAKANDLSDLLSKAEYVSQMTAYDRDRLEDYKAICKEIKNIKKSLETESRELNQLKTDEEENKAEIEKNIVDKKQQIETLEATVGEAEREKLRLAADLDAQNEILQQIAAKEKADAEAEKEANKKEEQDSQNGSDSNYGSSSTPEEPDQPSQPDSGASGGAAGGSLIWPTSGYISSYFGYRDQPTAGASTYHQGIDIAAGTGSPIVAAASGTVTVATYSSSAGNYIGISHPNGMYTVYMHCSALYVSAGQQVSAGQLIGAVGSTGYSTGPHLHFGVMVNGGYVDPMGYL